MEEVAANVTDEIDETVDEQIEDEVNVDDADDNNDEVGELDDANETSDDSEEPEVDEKKQRTKEYSDRLKKDREKIALEAEKKAQERLERIAKARGFESWDELENTANNEKLEEIGISDPKEFRNIIDSLVSEHPLLKEAQKVLEKQQEKEREAFIAEEIKRISTVNPNIKSFDDVLDLDRWDDISTKLDRGYTLADAYTAVYFDDIRKGTADNAQQDALKKITSKSHMKTASGGAAKEIHVPADIMATYKKNLPEMTDAQIREHYAKSIQD